MNTFPSSTLFHYPILLLLADGKVHTVKEMVIYEIDKLSISKHDQNVLTPKGENKVRSWTDFAISDLRSAKFIAYSKNDKGYVITNDGRTFLETHKQGFEGGDLKASESYRRYKGIGEFKKNKNNSSVQNTYETEQEGTTQILDQSITVKLSDLAASANENLPESLLDAVKRINPQSFEILIKKLLLKMGYGHSTDDVVVTQYSKDGGIDAYVNADTLGIKKLCCIQAKRYSDPVTVKTVRELVGSLAEYDCENGIIITTSSFTKDAKNYNTKHYRILLVDGRTLADYMIRYGLGIKTMRIEVKTVDKDFLNSLSN